MFRPGQGCPAGAGLRFEAMRVAGEVFPGSVLQGPCPRATFLSPKLPRVVITHCHLEQLQIRGVVPFSHLCPQSGFS